MQTGQPQVLSTLPRGQLGSPPPLDTPTGSRPPGIDGYGSSDSGAPGLSILRGGAQSAPASPYTRQAQNPELDSPPPYMADVVSSRSTPAGHKPKEMSPELKELRALMEITAREDEEVKVRQNAGQAAGAFILSLVKDVNGHQPVASGAWSAIKKSLGLQDEEREHSGHCIVEADTHVDGLKYVRVNGQWRYAESRYYCHLCGVFFDQKQVHLREASHHKVVEERRYLNSPGAQQLYFAENEETAWWRNGQAASQAWYRNGEDYSQFFYWNTVAEAVQWTPPSD